MSLWYDVPMENKTRIYLDVDGVLNALSFTNPPKDVVGWDEWESKVVAGFSIQYSPQLIAELNLLSERDDVEFVWLTTWREMAGELIAPALGLKGENWVYLTDGKSAGGYSYNSWVVWWKLITIQEHVTNSHTNFVWIDDDLFMNPDALSWVRGFKNGMSICPRPTHGLTRDDVSAILRFINERAVAEG